MVVFCSLSPKAIYPLGAMILKKPESDGKVISKEGTVGADPSLLTSIIPNPSKSATFSPLFEYQYWSSDLKEIVASAPKNLDVSSIPPSSSQSRYLSSVSEITKGLGSFV